jgi:hypothetical protein
MQRLAVAGPLPLALMIGLILLVCIGCGYTGLAWSQTVSAPPPAQSPPSQPPPVVQAEPEQPEQKPTPPASSGFIDAVGKFLKDPPLGLPPLKSPMETIDDINSGAKSAGDNLSRLSKGKVISGRVVCPMAGNGAPDCKVAATQMCVEKGFKEGRSLDSDSAESCAASVLLSGKQAGPQDCHIENYVIRALCQ